MNERPGGRYARPPGKSGIAGLSLKAARTKPHRRAAPLLSQGIETFAANFTLYYKGFLYFYHL